MLKTIIKNVVFTLVFSLCSCSSYVLNGGVQRVEESKTASFKSGTLSLVSYRTTPAWDLLDTDSKAWVLVLPDGTFHFFPLGADGSAADMLKTLGTVGSLIPTPTLPVPIPF